MVTVYTITYNEEVMIEFFINHYRKIFPNCEINVYDNYSTDLTVDIAKKYGCNVIPYDTNNELSDETYLQIKNNEWKNSKTDWVIVCDCDEFIEINESQLINEEKKLTNIVKPIGYSLMNNEWEKKPKKEDFTVDEKKIKQKAQQWMDIIDDAIEKAEGEDLEDAVETIKKYREKLRKYRSCGLKKEGEFSYENLVFKYLRRNGYISKLEDFKNKIADKKLSLEQENSK